ncbi:MAG: oxidoreductase, partial [Actinobacteria bacterium]|nr:oxidoreductase [Actinomycetota bacterium]
MTRDTPKTSPSPLAAAFAGVAAVALGAGLGELAAGLIAPASSPFAVVGGALIDAAPAWAKDTAIALFGTNDKAALLTGIAIALLALAAVAGWLEARRPPWGRIVFLAFGVIGVVVSMTRANASLISWLPSAVAGGASAVALVLLLRILRRASASSHAVSPLSADRPVSQGNAPRDAGRRTFFVWAGAATAAGVLAAVAGSALRMTSQAVA